MVHVPGERAVKRLVSQFVSDESGATAIEYALIAAGIALSIVIVVQSLGTSLSGRYDELAKEVK